MRHLITGGCGFLGTALAKELIRQGASVRAFDLKRSPDLPGEADFFEGDVRDAAKVKEAAAGCEIIHHLVGLMPQSRAPRDVMWSVNVEGTRYALYAAVAAKARRFVFLSSMEIYGYPESSPFYEDDPLRPLNEYGKTKLEGEKLCREYSEKHGIETVSLRPSTIVGPGINEPTFEMLLKVLKKSLPMVYVNDGSTRFQMSALSDCVAACVKAAEAPGVSGMAFNIGADDTPTLIEQIRDLKKLAGNRSRMFGLPAWFMKPMLLLLYKLGVSKLEPDHIALFDTDMVMDCSRAKQSLGFKSFRTNVDMIWETYQAYLKSGT